MNKIFAAIAVFLLYSTPIFSDVHVNGYTNYNGTNVQPYYRSNPNGTLNDNWSTQGNINPYTGVGGNK